MGQGRDSHDEKAKGNPVSLVPKTDWQESLVSYLRSLHAHTCAHTHTHALF
jgi:hypothetical protein